jgi:Kef-type K+ transport system membrane component KefB
MRCIHLTSVGGLHTSFQSLKANLLLSSGVALTGIAVPIGLSYTLQGLLDATPVQAFAAGTALCSTSLGTTFTVLGSSGLSTSRLGVVLTSAAMMDDVVGLVMVQVISNLGGDNFSWVTVVRPVLVSVAFAVVAPVACLFVVRPMTLWLNKYREVHPTAAMNELFRRTSTALFIHTLILIGLVAGATYAGTSNLFAAYIAGATVSWWDSEVPHPAKKTNERAVDAAGVSQQTGPSSTAGQESDSQNPNSSNDKDITPAQPSTTAGHVDEGSELCGAEIYERHYHPAVSKILQPLFFASIGFSIPITRMFRGSIVWRGIVYTVLMAFAKFVCGLWLVRFPTSSKSSKGTVKQMLSKVKLPSVPHFWGKNESATTAGASNTTPTPTPTPARDTPTTSAERRSSSNPAKPFSLHPPLILALAMCARGEIGFLISGVAESNGIFSASGEASSEPSEIFLVVTWAIVLCTIVGPLGVGLSVRRVKKLQERKERQQEGAGRDVLGVWGVE